MMKCVATCMVFIFLFASSGMNKLVSFNFENTVEISLAHQGQGASAAACCDNGNSRLDAENPRCLGDNCLSDFAALFLPEPFSIKVGSANDPSLTEAETSRFLRPPIT